VTPSFLTRLRSGEQLLGTVVTCRDPALAELVGLRFHFAWIDLEHSMLDVGDVPALAVALRAAQCAALVRLPSSRFERLTAVLDFGVDGVVVPRVEDVAEAADVVARIRYPPFGTRGLAARRGVGYGQGGPHPPSVAACLVQIESRTAVSSSAAIAAIDGIDGLVVGTADLALDLGVEPDLAEPEIRDALSKVQAAAHGAGIAFGLAVGGDPKLIATVGPGHPEVVVYSADVRIYAQAVADAVGRLSAALHGDATHKM
jgi:2-keto-3-deoxy-L-rhamnonate aldolase RhmA